MSKSALSPAERFAKRAEQAARLEAAHATLKRVTAEDHKVRAQAYGDRP